ncbi:capsule biosynthesis protein [Tropicimonas sediminicola]|uniref:Capsular polysaccharide transport system permease protein n=1 Tax=Tropicimonas sediminicola TaxID=1031541 RepID=A0A239F2Q9_9RHOB|nr:capsule biosynthesis protein [Tropicimonas sediminicola]SNS50394.1 capsular polysaccharide transport system permease protein [Tropicimonas sediminicola]
MTTKAKARKYRLRRSDALAEGVSADGVARARAAIQAARSASQASEADAAPNPANSADAPAEARSGEISTPQDVASETDIAAIRREGLTGRQLRLARRMAQKHGLAVTSDFDAVRQLRARGIDPFERAAMLELVPTEARTGTSEANYQLPQTVEPTKPPALPEVPLSLPEDRAGEIYRIQQDIARRRRRNTMALFARLAVFVFLPTLLAGWYYAVMATPMYATKSEFVIQQADISASPGGLGNLFRGTGLAVQQDSTTVQSYLQSRDAMLRLDADLGFKAHFQQDWIDPIQRLDPDATNEAAYKLYTRNVQVGFDPTEGILKMEVIAADPQTSQAFAEALIGYAEEQVDQLTQRLREDQMSGALQSYESAEQKVADAQDRVLALQEELGVLDPVSETGSMMQQITTFEVQLSEKKLMLEQLLSNPRPNEARVAGTSGDVARLEALIEDLRGSMTESGTGKASLARISGQLRIAEADMTTRQLLLQQAATQLEMARIEANRQVRYMAVGVRPVAPDEPTYPRAFENTLLAFAIFAGIYLMVSLTASVLREQISA